METRHSLKQMILNEIDNQPRGYAEILAPIAAYSSGSNLKKVLRDEKKEFEKFSGLVNLVKFLFPNDELRLMEEYSKTINTNSNTARRMLEYLSCNRLLDTMNKLINRMSECKNEVSKEYAKIYKIQWDWQTNYYNLDVNAFLKIVNETKSNIAELKVFLELLKFYGYYRNQNYRMSYEISKYIEPELIEIKDEYIRNMYLGKFNEALSYIELRVLNNPEGSRIRSEAVIAANTGLSFTSYAQYSIGCSYMFTSYEKAMCHFNESIKLYQSANRENVVESILEKVDILNILWDKNEEVSFSVAKLLLSAKKGKLYDIESVKKEIDLSFYLLIKGIKNNDCDLLLQSLIEFLRMGDAFLGNISKIELLKRNYNEGVLNALISLNNV